MAVTEYESYQGDLRVASGDTVRVEGDVDGNVEGTTTLGKRGRATVSG